MEGDSGARSEDGEEARHESARDFIERRMRNLETADDSEDEGPRTKREEGETSAPDP
jgi:hypothetical protein